MSRDRILKSPAYWTARIQTQLYNCAENFMSANNLNRTQLASHLGVSKAYVSQLLNGDYDHKLSKFVSLALSFGYIPELRFTPTESMIETDHCKSISLQAQATPPTPAKFTTLPARKINPIHLSATETYDTMPTATTKIPA